MVSFYIKKITLLGLILGFGQYQILAKKSTIKISEKTPWILAEVVSTPAAKAQGLMGPRTLPWLAGMLFVYSKPGIYYFWMKDTFINLDILFFNKKKLLLGCLSNMQAGSLQAKTIQHPSQIILEVNAGFCNYYQLQKHDKLIIRHH